MREEVERGDGKGIVGREEWEGGKGKGRKRKGRGEREKGKRGGAFWQIQICDYTPVLAHKCQTVGLYYRLSNQMFDVAQPTSIHYSKCYTLKLQNVKKHCKN